MRIARKSDSIRGIQKIKDGKRCFIFTATILGNAMDKVQLVWLLKELRGWLTTIDYNSMCLKLLRT